MKANDMIFSIFYQSLFCIYNFGKNGRFDNLFVNSKIPYKTSVLNGITSKVC